MPLTNMSIKIKAMCACGEEVTEKESDDQKQIEPILLTDRQHKVSIQTVVETIIGLLQARPAESKRKTRDKLIQEIAMCIAYALPYHYCEDDHEALGWIAKDEEDLVRAAMARRYRRETHRVKVP